MLDLPPAPYLPERYHPPLQPQELLSFIQFDERGRVEEIMSEENKLHPGETKPFRYSIKPYDPTMHRIKIKVVYSKAGEGKEVQVSVGDSIRILEESNRTSG